jgi:hypothetical protein
MTRASAIFKSFSRMADWLFAAWKEIFSKSSWQAIATSSQASLAAL